MSVMDDAQTLWDYHQMHHEPFTGYLVSFSGMVLAATWWILIRSYRDLNKAKFAVILSMEARMEIRIFGDEWASLKADPVKGWAKRYAEFSFVERVVPIPFFALYATNLIHWITR